jgi:hypothetical protein
MPPALLWTFEHGADFDGKETTANEFWGLNTAWKVAFAHAAFR